MKPIYTLITKEINGKQYVIGYQLARESDGTDLIKDEIEGPLPGNLYSDDGLPLYRLTGSALVYDPAPMPSSMVLKKELIALQAYLNETDWYVIRQADSGKPVPADIATEREQARNRISKIREELEIKMEDSL